MEFLKYLMLLFLIGDTTKCLCNGQDTDLFYPFGNEDIRSPRTDDGSSPEILLEKPFVYFGRVNQKTYVNNNGHLTFDGPFSQPMPYYLQSQFNRDIIAPLWTDMDNTVNGTISYRQVTSGGLLLAASNNINQYFPNLNFTASWLFIATWDKVPYYNNLQSKSTFQVVLVSGKTCHLQSCITVKSLRPHNFLCPAMTQVIQLIPF
ncbi:sushi, nidogen and EGF-like domain-containing protein 1 [Puntigrus tetrazona]|uniref:sushi, nidogen and EGF-like domain-containing protein 1 n=1 Tax=Puntigrus tetrazona TaxID=1606681 RepID=UPI001C8A0070|nr:sushi, nidogen and EGF-like domain-containing protein 1 [Puntigrus tetrazona]